MFLLFLKVGHQVFILAAFYVCFDDVYGSFDTRPAGVDQKVVLVAAAPFIVGVELVVSAALLVDLSDSLLCGRYIKEVLRLGCVVDLQFSSDSVLKRGKEEYADMSFFRKYIVSSTSDYDTAALGCDLSDNIELFLLNFCER